MCYNYELNSAKQHPSKSTGAEIVAGNFSDTRMSFPRSAVKLCSKLCYMRRIIPRFSKQAFWQESPARQLQAASPLHWSWGSVWLRHFGSQVLQEMLPRARALVWLLLSSSPSFPFVSSSVGLRSHVLPAYPKSGSVLWSCIARSCRWVRTTWAPCGCCPSRAVPHPQLVAHAWTMSCSLVPSSARGMGRSSLKTIPCFQCLARAVCFCPSCSGQETTTAVPGHVQGWILGLGLIF